MKIRKITAHRIPNCYVGEDCALIMIPFTRSIMIHEKESFLEKNIICRYNVTNRNVSIVNNYLEDSRRNNLPYSDIPLHISIKGLKKIYYVNQLYDFDKDYWCMVDYDITKYNMWGEEYQPGHVIHQYLLKDNTDIILVSEYYNLNIYDKLNRLKKELPRRKYTIEEIKYLMSVKIKNMNNPRFDYILNPNITREEIENSKRLTRKLSK